jgi:UDP-N-acetylglucosamine--N-acetylmuramyl-(pentapeptide) pyrophosphoryl-undecaprenol N-acetylglucosamine transferase
LARILYGVSPIGLGHASRAAAVGLKLREKGLEPVFATGGPASGFLASYGFDVRDVVTEPTPSERGGRMRYPALWYLRYWSGYRSTRSRMESLIDSTRPEAIVGDEEFSCVSLAIERGIRHALISDELELGFAQTGVSRYVEKRVDAWYKDLQRRASSILVPDFGEDRGNVHFVSPVVRELTTTRERVRSALGVEPSRGMVLLSASGSGIGRFLLDRVVAAMKKLALPGVDLFVTGLPAGPPHDGTRYLGFQRDNQDLVSAADLVVSTAGKSIIDEAASYGSPIIAIPIENHSEQERNASALGFTHADLGRLPQLIPLHLGRRSEPRNYRGADSVTRFVQDLLTHAD